MLCGAGEKIRRPCGKQVQFYRINTNFSITLKVVYLLKNQNSRGSCLTSLQKAFLGNNNDSKKAVGG